MGIYDLMKRVDIQPTVDATNAEKKVYSEEIAQNIGKFMELINSVGKGRDDNDQ